MLPVFTVSRDLDERLGGRICRKYFPDGSLFLPVYLEYFGVPTEAVFVWWPESRYLL